MVVLRALGLGDLLTVVPALRALAGAFPEHPLLLACPAALAPLARLSGAVDEVVPTAGLADGPLRPRLHHAAVAVNLHGRGPESHQLLLATAPERLVGFAHPVVPASALPGCRHPGGAGWRRPRRPAPGPAVGPGRGGPPRPGSHSR